MIGIISVIATALVAIAVVYREWIHSWFFRPKLEVTFSLEEPTSRESVVGVPTYPTVPAQYARAFWPRLRVKNNGRSVARRCECILSEVRNPKGELDKRYDPLALRWAIAPINRGFEPLNIATNRVVNLNTFVTIKGDSKAQFATHPDPRGVPLYLEPGDCWLRIVTYGDNFKPVSRGYAVQWDGKDYKGVKMKEMNEMPSDTTPWPWPVLSKTESSI